MISTCLPSYIQCWPMAEPVYGARYLKPAASDGGRRHDRRVLEGAGLFEGAAHGGDRRALLPDGDVDAAHLLLLVAGLPGLLLVDDRVGRDGRLAGLPVADDQLALAAADRGQRVDRLEPGLQRLADALPLHHRRRLHLERPALGRSRCRRARRAAARAGRRRGRGRRRRPAPTAPRRYAVPAGPLRCRRSRRARRRRSRGCRGSARCRACRPRTRAARWPSPTGAPRRGRCRPSPRRRCRPPRGWRRPACSRSRSAAAPPGSPPAGSSARSCVLPLSLRLVVQLCWCGVLAGMRRRRSSDHDQPLLACASLVSIVESMTSSPMATRTPPRTVGVDDDVEVHLVGVLRRERAPRAGRRWSSSSGAATHDGGDQPLTGGRGDLLVVRESRRPATRCRPTSSWSSRSMVTGATLPSTSPSSRLRLASSGAARSESASRRSGLAARMRPKRNRSSSSSSSWPSCSALVASAITAQRSSASTRSRLRDQRSATAASTTWTAAVGDLAVEQRPGHAARAARPPPRARSAPGAGVGSLVEDADDARTGRCRALVASAPPSRISSSASSRAACERVEPACISRPPAWSPGPGSRGSR